MAQAHNIPIQVEEDKIKEGWVGKPKRIHQILWEHGLLDSACSYVAKIMKKDESSEDKVENSSVLDDCYDFLNEKTCLMYLGERLGVKVDHSMKSHLERVGEGIQYSWGCTKGVYRWATLSKEKGKDNFGKLVQDCLSVEVGERKGGLTLIWYGSSVIRQGTIYWHIFTWSMKWRKS